MTLCSCISDF